MSQPLKVDREDTTWTFTLQRPEKRNALSADLVDQLLDGVADAHAQRAQVLVFRGDGRNFSAGFDFAGVEAQSEGDLLLRFVRIELLLQAVSQSPCLTLALAHGKNFGAGVDLFAACRHRVAAPDATFRMPGLKFGLVLGTRRFGEIVGRQRASGILEEAATFDAGQALEIGFIQQTCEPAAWAQAVHDRVATAGALDPWSRGALNDALSSAAPDADLATLVRSAGRPGLKDRIAAYLQA